MNLAQAAEFRLFVDFQDGTSLEEARAISNEPTLEWVHERTADESLAYIDLPDDSLRQQLRTRLVGTPTVEAAEAPVEYFASSFPDDPLYGRQWNFQRIGVETGWRVGAGRGVRVAVIDTGVSAVSDLAGISLLEGVSFVAGESTSDDLNGHGTHVAGTIAQATHNGLGTSGIAPGVELLPIKVLGATGGGQSAWIAAGIDEAVDRGAKILNLSLGGGRSEIIEIAVKKAVDAGVLVVVAAGNSGSEGVQWPAAVPGAFAVSAVGPQDRLAPYSTWGQQIAISAPGGDKSQTNGGILQQTRPRGGSEEFAELQGTSMAAPHVAGAAAVLWSWSGGSAQRVRSTLESSAVDLGSPGRDKKYGAGRLDLDAAVRQTAWRHHFLRGLAGLALAFFATRGSLGGRGAVPAALLAGWAAGLFAPLALYLPGGLPPLVSGLPRPHLLFLPLLDLGQWTQNAVAFSAILPTLAVFFWGPSRRLGPLVAGWSIGIGIHLIEAGVWGGLSSWPLPYSWNSAWLVANGLIALFAAAAALGAGRLLDRERP